MTATETRRRARPTAARAATDRQRLLGLFITRGTEGLTDHEASAELGLILDTTRARRVELRDLGLVVDSGARRPSPSGRAATVWVRAAAVGPKPSHFPLTHIEAPTSKPARCPRCGSTATVDVPIHAGASTRRDCAKCGRFVAFVRWHAQPITPE